MGTYVLDTAFSLDSNTGTFVGDPFGGVCSSANADILTSLNNQTGGGVAIFQQRFCDGTTSTPATGLLRISHGLTNNAISVDGGAHISFFGLTPGFRVLSELFSIHVGSNLSVGPGTLGFLQFDQLTESSSFTFDGIGSSGVIRTFNNPDSPLSTLGLFTNGIGLRYSNFPFFGIVETMRNWNISGNYDILSASITIPSPSANGPLNITATNNLDTISRIQIFNPSGGLLQDISSFNSQSPTSLKFNLSVGSYAGNSAVMGLTPTGWAFLGPMTIVLGDPSGLYVIVPGQTHDTLYVDHSSMTQNVAIPSPFIKTGFIGG